MIQAQDFKKYNKIVQGIINIMSRKCEICGKGRQTGNSVSHANNKNKKVWFPNIKKVKVGVKGRQRHIKVCTNCIKSGRVLKVS